MKSKRKVCVVLTARASYAKIKSILVALSAKEGIELQIICAASAVLERYGKVDAIVEKDGFEVNERIHMLLEAETLLTSVKSLGMGVIEFAGAFNRLKPDVVLVMADRFEVLAPAIAAAYQNIPLAHVQGGEVSGNIDEKVRHSISKLADLHFPATERAKQWLIRMGEDPGAVFHVGCPSMDLAELVIRNPSLDFDIYKKYSGVGEQPPLNRGFIVVMQHPVTTEYGDARNQITETLMAVADINKTVLWFWPNPDAGSDAISKEIRVFRENNKSTHIHFLKNMEPIDFLRLLYASNGIVGNSSAAIRECSYLGVPAINIGSRQKNRERGPNVIDAPYEKLEIKRAIECHLTGRTQRSHIYGYGDAGEKIAETLSSHTLTFCKSLNYLKVVHD